MNVLYVILASYASAGLAAGILLYAYRSKTAQPYLIRDDPHRSNSDREVYLRVALNTAVSVTLIFSVMYGLGASAILNIVPQFMLHAFTKAAVNDKYNVYPWAAGIHFVRRKKLLDMTVRVMFGHYGLRDGNWLGANHNFDETDYTEFHNMNFLWADITWTWHTRIAKGFYLSYGVGIGIGGVIGKVYTTPSIGCTSDNYSNVRQGSGCAPSLPAVCDGRSCTRDSLATHPMREQEKSVPPVLPAINGTIGFRYDIFRHMSIKLDTGLFVPGFFFFQLSTTFFF